MIKRMIVLIVVLVMCAQVQAGDITTWVWGDSDALGTRVGAKVSKDVEVGLSALWLPDQEKPILWGVYGIYNLPKIEVPNPIVADFLPKTIIGMPYFGAKVDIDFNFDQSMTSPIAGMVFNNILFLEYQFASIDRQAKNESKIIFGLRIEF